VMNSEINLKKLTSLMIPADDARGLPDGSKVSVEEFLELEGIYEKTLADLEKLRHQLTVATGLNFIELTQNQFDVLLKEQKKIFEPVVKQVGPALLKAYYTNPIVQKGIGVGNKPPFPEGKSVYEGNLELLEPVFNRGPIYRSIES
jgi:hypothetical protein